MGSLLRLLPLVSHREAGLGAVEEGGLFLTSRELEALNRYFVREAVEQGEDRVLYTVGGK